MARYPMSDKDRAANLNFNSYESFLDYINNFIPKYTETVLYLIPIDGRLIVFKHKDNIRISSGNYPKFVCSYEFENKQMQDLMYKILDLKPDGDGRMFVATFSNYFSFIIKPEILKVIFRYNLLISNNIKPYNHFKIPKKSGGMRDIIAPEGTQKKNIVLPGKTLAECLSDCNHLFQKIFDNVNKSFQVAYKCGKNIKDNAKIHKNKKFIFEMDLKDFYPSCKRELVSNELERVFEKSLNGDTLKEMFLDSILYNDALFIGSPVSGCLANKIISSAALYMRNICKTHNMEFSIYADDLTFSSDRWISENFANGILTQALIVFGLDVHFKANQKKSHGNSKNRRRITGVSLNNNDECTVSRKYYRDLRSSISHLKAGDFNGNIQKLRGKFAFATMVDESGKIRRLIAKEKQTIVKYKIISDEKLEKMGV